MTKTWLDILGIKEHTLNVNLEINKHYTLSVKTNRYTANNSIELWQSDDFIGYFINNTITFKASISGSTALTFKSNDGSIIIEMIKLETGAVATGQVFAPEDFANYKGKRYIMSESIVPYEQYTLSYNGSIVAPEFIGVWGGDSFIGYMNKTKPLTFKLTRDLYINNIILKSSNERGITEWVKLEKGKTATIWELASKDKENALLIQPSEPTVQSTNNIWLQKI